MGLGNQNTQGNRKSNYQWQSAMLKVMNNILAASGGGGTPKNTVNHYTLTAPAGVVYSNWKKISFVCSSSVDVVIDGQTITYPQVLDGVPVLGATLEADSASTNSIRFTGTGTVLVNILT